MTKEPKQSYKKKLNAWETTHNPPKQQRTLQILSIS